MKVKEFIGNHGKLQIEQAIKEAELNTSGEIREILSGSAPIAAAT